MRKVLVMKWLAVVPVTVLLAACGATKIITHTQTQVQTTTQTVAGPTTTITKTKTVHAPAPPAKTVTTSAAPASAPSGGGWPTSERTTFVNSCVATAAADYGTALAAAGVNPATYCGCMADTLAQSVSANQVGSLAADDPRVTAAVGHCKTQLGF